MGVTDRLRAPDLPELLTRLGFSDRSRDAAVDAAAEVLGDAEDRARVEDLALGLAQAIGGYPTEVGKPDAFSPQDARHRRGTAVLPLLAFVATAEDVHAHHLERGIDTQQSWRSLADLGIEVGVNERVTGGGFGLHSPEWLREVWAGDFHQLGRLQFHVARFPFGDRPLFEDADPHPRTVLNCHIPATGPLTAEAVDASFAQVLDFYGRHYPEVQVSEVACDSWLLDPALAEALPGSNIASFGQRWRLVSEGRDGNRDATFFTFNSEPGPELSSFPQQTRLQRAVVAGLRSERGWRTCCGTLARWSV